MSLKPFYEPNLVTPCYKLRYGWVGWPTTGGEFPKEIERHLSAPAKGWERDGIRLLETDFSPERLLMTFSVKPHVAPTLFTGRVKGRLQHDLAGAGVRVKFSRKVAMRTIGENHREDDWYNLHLVLVTAERWRNCEVPWLTKSLSQKPKLGQHESQRKRSAAGFHRGLNK